MSMPALAAAQSSPQTDAAPATNAEQSAPEDAQARALELFEQSKELYRKGDFQAAARLLEQAHATFPAPVLVYNLARAYEGLGEHHKAADAYERYLAGEPNAPDRGGIERRVQTLRRSADAGAPAPKVEPPRTTGVPPPEPRKVSAVPWVIAATGAAAAGVGVGLGLLARSRHDDAVTEPDATGAEASQGEAEQLALGANISLIGGGILAAAGGVWGIIDLSSSSRAVRSSSTAVRVGPTSIWLSLSF